ncbi:MAG: hypothetical protein K2L96_02985 [Muribaculaceae bacterium]|nr:hypothetical protein [Muribaculaceae bacterium]
MTRSLFTAFLSALGVPHTETFSCEAFEGMTFKSLFGLTKLLQTYGIESEGLRFDDKAAAYAELPAPVLVQFDGCFAVVESKDSEGVVYKSPDAPAGARMSKADFLQRWTGVALIAYPTAASTEPDLSAHRFSELIRRLIPWGLWIAALLLLGALGWYSGTFTHPATAVVLALNLFGLYVSVMLVQKSAGIHTASADRVCSIIERTGCNTVLSTNASKLGGVISWSAVGFGYFTVNTLVVLLAPEAVWALALLNLFCLPFSFWSIWYQHYRAGAWCTLCLFVQATLWAIFVADFAGGLIHWHSQLWMQPVILLAAYVLVVLITNKLTSAFEKAYNKN